MNSTAMCYLVIFDVEELASVKESSVKFDDLFVVMFSPCPST